MSKLEKARAKLLRFHQLAAKIKCCDKSGMLTREYKDLRADIVSAELDVLTASFEARKEGS